MLRGRASSHEKTAADGRLSGESAPTSRFPAPMYVSNRIARWVLIISMVVAMMPAEEADGNAQQRLYDIVEGHGVIPSSLHSTGDGGRPGEEGHSSGAGSPWPKATGKAEWLTHFVEQHSLHSVIEFGCGDGDVLSQWRPPCYHGYDISHTTIAHNRGKFKRANCTFSVLGPLKSARRTADLTLSMEVLQNLVDRAQYDAHLRKLFHASRRWVAIFSNHTSRHIGGPHTGSRRLTDDVALYDDFEEVREAAQGLWHVFRRTRSRSAVLPRVLARLS